MIISLLLGRQIAAMLLMVLMGYAVVRLRLLKAEDSTACRSRRDRGPFQTTMPVLS